MSHYRVVVTDHDFDDLSIERDVLGDIADVISLPDGDGTDTGSVDEVLADADGVLNLRYTLDRPRIEQMEACRIIARYGIGVDNVATDTASDRGIYVTNVPAYCLEEVAIHAISHVLALARGLKAYDASLARGEWNRDVAAPIHRLSSQTVGLVGYGATGRAVGERVAALGADVVAFDPFVSSEDIADDPADLLEFGELLDRSDYVSVHSPLTENTRCMFDTDAFTQMNQSAYLINVARGPIVDGDALLSALDDGEIAGAGLDVFPEEPPDADDPLLTHDKVLATPHVAWYSEEANVERRRSAAESVRAALDGRTPDHVVNGGE